MRHSNISITWLLANMSPRAKAGKARRSALYWRSKGKVFLPLCPVANPDGSCAGHQEPEKETAR